jgi:GT2 family glycosyltransferase
VRISVVVPTYRRPEGLRQCLDALARQLRPADEILVVARPVDEASHKIVERHHAKGLYLIQTYVPDERSGLVTALNAGIKASSGGIVAFTDDDAEPHPDWIERLSAVYATDPRIGAVGGRDWVYHGDRLEDGAKLDVGTLSAWGRLTGNHHLGVGPGRDVDVLKGVNLSVRGSLIRELGVDERLRGVGTQHHIELSLCLKLRSLGYRVIYDPAIAVDHRPRPRAVGHRSLDTFAYVRNAAHNETLAVLEYQPAWRRSLYLLWAIGIGTSSAPGMAQTIRSLVKSGKPRLPMLMGALAGRMLGLVTYRRSQHKEGGQIRDGTWVER